MSDPVIRAEGVSKQFHIVPLNRGETLRERLASIGSRGIRPLLRRRNGDAATLWALRDVTFEVRRGAVVGIIGRNGAGKSTLLKILSRIMRPTRGYVEVRGRVASLLEVGTGFHPELSGRENVFLNGAILGMTKGEIRRKFDEIAAFAEIDTLLDTPVKRYSSGMYVRLAFAVAAHLEPEILVVDEVLAVGDAAFQRKCLGKMGDVARAGQTVLMVSHNLAAISGLCTGAMLIDEGRLVKVGSPDEAVREYVRRTTPPGRLALPEVGLRRGDGPLRFCYVRIEDADGVAVSHVVSGQKCRLVLGFDGGADRCYQRVEVAVAIYHSSGLKVTNVSSHYFNDEAFDAIPGKGEFVCDIPRAPFRSGQYTLELFCQVNGQVSDWIRDIAGLEVSDGDYFGTGRITHPNQGTVFVDHHWAVRPQAQDPVHAETDAHA